MLNNFKNIKRKEKTDEKVISFTSGCSTFCRMCYKRSLKKAYHPTDDVNASSQGGKGFESDGSEVDFGLDEEPAKVQYEDPKKYYPKK